MTTLTVNCGRWGLLISEVVVCLNVFAGNNLNALPIDAWRAAFVFLCVTLVLVGAAFLISCVTCCTCFRLHVFGQWGLTLASACHIWREI